MKIPLRPTHLVINLGQLRQNVENIRARVYPAKVLVMLKGNAYGHGMDGIAPFIEPYLDYIGVAVLDEGVHLRELGITKPILVAGGTLPEFVPYYLQYDLTLTVSSLEILDAAEKAAQEAGKRLKVHIKIDTGMERSGTRWYEAEPLLERSLQCHNLEIEGIYTHFANSETIEQPGMEYKAGYSYASKQLERFEGVLEFYRKRGLPYPPLRHTANSAAILNLPQSYYDMVRPGMMFYGVYPDEDALRTVDIAPVATWKSAVVYSKLTLPGNPVSYGSTWVSDHPVHTVTIPCGYADGYSRHMAGKPSVIICGKKYRQVGRICMDQCMINLEQDEARVGDEVILLGKDPQSGQQISVEELADWHGTNTYEVMTSITARVPRVFVVD